MIPKITNSFITQADAQTFSDYITKYKDTERFDTHVGLAHKEGEAARAVFPERTRPSDHIEIKEVVDKYANLFIEQLTKDYDHPNPLHFYGISITRLTAGVQLRIHRDIHTVGPIIKYSGVMYLNDDWDGGEITFLDEFTPKSKFDIYEDEMEGLVYKPNAGDLFTFPADAWHGGRKITRGSRDAVVLWATDSTDHIFHW